MFALHELETRDAQTGWINVVIDTPGGSRNKFKYNEARGVFMLSRMLPLGMTFPFDFGSIPRTRAEDGDALDVLVLIDAPTFPGCLVAVRVLGVLLARQKVGGRIVRNDRLIAVPVTSVNDPPEQDIGDLSRLMKNEIESFFITYNRLQGREFVSAGWRGAKAAERILESATRAFGRGRKPRSG